jgi:hypothetical protein
VLTVHPFLVPMFRLGGAVPERPAFTFKACYRERDSRIETHGCAVCVWLLKLVPNAKRTALRVQSLFSVYGGK